MYFILLVFRYSFEYKESMVIPENPLSKTNYKPVFCPGPFKRPILGPVYRPKVAIKIPRAPTQQILDRTEAKLTNSVTHSLNQ